MGWKLEDCMAAGFALSGTESVIMAECWAIAGTTAERDAVSRATESKMLRRVMQLL